VRKKNVRKTNRRCSWILNVTVRDKFNDSVVESRSSVDR